MDISLNHKELMEALQSYFDQRVYGPAVVVTALDASYEGEELSIDGLRISTKPKPEEQPGLFARTAARVLEAESTMVQGKPRETSYDAAAIAQQSRGPGAPPSATNPKFPDPC